MDEEVMTTVDRLSIVQSYHTAQARQAEAEGAVAELEVTIADTQAAIAQLGAELQAYYARSFDGNYSALTNADQEAARLESMIRICNEGITKRNELRRQLDDFEAQSAALFAPYSGVITNGR